jgi:hypothetical protein
MYSGFDGLSFGMRNRGRPYQGEERDETQRGKQFPGPCP